eukprot:1592155-Pyramimonas_sp.AAC.1
MEKKRRLPACDLHALFSFDSKSAPAAGLRQEHSAPRQAQLNAPSPIRINRGHGLLIRSAPRMRMR